MPAYSRQTSKSSRALQSLGRQTSALPRPPGIRPQTPIGYSENEPPKSVVDRMAAACIQQTPLLDGSAIHRSLLDGLVSASELGALKPMDPVAYAGEALPEVACVLRFPYAIAKILRQRLAASMVHAHADMKGGGDGRGDSISLGQHSMLGRPGVPAMRGGSSLSGQSSGSDPARINLGLEIVPSIREDYRFFNLFVEVRTSEEHELIKGYHPSFRYTDETPSSTRVSLLPVSNIPPGRPLGIIHLHGLLVELPCPIEAYKSVESNDFFKSQNIGQMIQAFFPEDSHLFFGSSVSNPAALHRCQNTNRLYGLALQHFCPWLWPSGLTPPLHRFRDRYLIDNTLFDPADVRTAEREILALMEAGTAPEVTYFDLVPGVEQHMQHSARSNKSSPESQTLKSYLCPPMVAHPVAMNVVSVIRETDDINWDNAGSDFSDELFGIDPEHEVEILEYGPPAALQRGSISGVPGTKAGAKPPAGRAKRKTLLRKTDEAQGTLKDEFAQLSKTQQDASDKQAGAQPNVDDLLNELDLDEPEDSITAVHRVDKTAYKAHEKIRQMQSMNSANDNQNYYGGAHSPSQYDTGFD